MRACLKRDAVMRSENAQLRIEEQKRIYADVAGRLRGKACADRTNQTALDRSESMTFRTYS